MKHGSEEEAREAGVLLNGQNDNLRRGKKREVGEDGERRGKSRVGVT